MILVLVIVIVVWGVATERHREGRSAAIVAILAGAGTIAGYAWLFLAPEEDGFNFGAAALLGLSLWTLVLSSLLAWTQNRDARDGEVEQI